MPPPRLARIRLVAGALLLTGLAFVQSPGNLIADSKLDLAADPGGFLARAAHLWDGGAAFGQLQNQAYGYGWPMGPFFWLGDTVGLDGWVVQRLWLALVLITAFVGAAVVTRALGVRSELACLVAGAAYATSPRLVSIVGGVSIEAWPSALAPWVLLPLVLGAERGSPRRAAALSALAIGMVGGVNAAATAAVLPLGVVWLLSRTSGPRRRALMLWWPIFTFLATAWWLVPLFVLGAYSPPFLDWIESASVTTFPTTPFDALRGTSAWIPYVDSGWGAGNDLLRTPQLIVNSGVLLVAGILGLQARRNPQRLFLVLSVILGMLLVSLGHLGEVRGWFAGTAQSSLDAALAPLRNVHKFDPVIRLPMVVGLGWFLESLLLTRSPPRATGTPRSGPLTATVELVGRHGQRVGGVAVVVIAVLATASPAALGRLAPEGALPQVPDYWKQAADWLEEEPGSGTSLLVPGSSFGSYVWGEPRDEPFQFLARSPWAVRNAVPLAPAGNIRMLDAVEERLAQGQGSPGLAAYLARAGVEHVVVRNDLTRSSDVPDPVLVHRALQDSPGITAVKGFGPTVGGGPTATVDGRRVLVSGGWQSAYPALQVYEVVAPPAAATATTAPMTVVGGPEDLLDLADLGLLNSGPTLLATEGDTRAQPPGPVVLTDGLRDRERFFGRIHDSASAVRFRGSPRRTGNPTSDYLLPGHERWVTRAVALGNARITVSSSAADAGVPGGSRTGFHPYAAVDGDPDTSFLSAPLDSSPTWRLTTAAEVGGSEMQLTGGKAADGGQRVLVRTERGVVGTVPLGPGERRQITLPADGIEWVEVARATGRGALDLAEVSLPGVSARRGLRTPPLPERWGAPDALVLRSDLDARTGCVTVDGQVRCSPEQQRRVSEEPGVLRRRVGLPEARQYPIRVLARLDERNIAPLLAGQLGSVSASSTQYDDLQASALAAVDDDPGTTWLAAQIDEQPRLSFGWLKERQVRGMTLTLDPDAPGRAPRRVRLTWDGGERVVRLDAAGTARWRPFRATSFTAEILAADDAVSLGFDGVGSPLPIGVSEARVKGVPEFPLRFDRPLVSTRCGSGPTLVVNGRWLRTRIVSAAPAVLAGETFEATPCGSATVTLRAGRNRVALRPGDGFLPSAVVLGDIPAASVTTLGEAVTGPTTREFTGSGSAQLVGTPENANPGWTARQGGDRVTPVVVDGWRQGWWSGSEEPIQAQFSPDGPYRAGLVGGGVLVLLLLVGLWLPGRRLSFAPALAPTSLRWAYAALAAVLAAGLLAGWAGAALALAWTALLRTLLAWMPGAAAGLNGALVGLAAVAYTVRPWGSPVTWAGTWQWPAQAVVLAAVGALVVVAGRGRPSRRSAGRSTSQ